MTLDRRKLRWNGWGWAHATFELGAREPAVWAYIAEALGRDKFARSPAVPLPDIHMAGSRLDDATLANLQAITGIEHVKTDRYERACSEPERLRIIAPLSATEGSMCTSLARLAQGLRIIPDSA